MIRKNKVGYGFQVYETHIQQISKFMNKTNITMKGCFQIDGVYLQPNTELQYSCDFIIDCYPQNIKGCTNQYRNDINYKLINNAELQLFEIRQSRFAQLQDIQTQKDEAFRTEDINTENQQYKEKQATEMDENLRTLDEEDIDGGLDENITFNDTMLDDETQIQISNKKDEQFQELYFQNQSDLVYSVEQVNEQEQNVKKEQSISLSDSSVEQEEKQDYNIIFTQQLLDQLNQQFKYRKQKEVSQLKIRKTQQQKIIQYKIFQEAQQMINKAKISAYLDYMKIAHIEISEIPQFIIVLHYNSIQLQNQQNEQNDISGIVKIKIFAIQEYINYFDILNIKHYDIEYADKKTIVTVLLPQYIQQIDPDIIFSWHNQQNGLGRICKIALNYEYDFLGKISRTPQKQSQFVSQLLAQFANYKEIVKNIEQRGINTQSLQCNGRIIFNLQQLIVKQIKLVTYSISQVCQALQIQDHSYELNNKIIDKILNNEPDTIKILMKNQNFDYLKYNIDKIKKLAQIVQKAELLILFIQSSNLFEVPIYEAVIRGSQYRVESYLSREAWKRDYILGPSPTKLEVNNMRALNCIPLVMEPSSKYYSYPILVYDFASLYPSVICAYNLCYTTIFNSFEQQQKIGCCYNELDTNVFQNLSSKNILYSPMQCMFVDQTIKKGILPIMVEDCLQLRKETVQMENIFQAQIEKVYSYIDNMTQKQREQYQKDINQILSKMTTIRQKLHHYQKQLKMLLNTTYGYTSASFSGRMPCQEIADSIVEISRQTLEYFIVDIQNKFDVDVIYADTDSMFIDTQKQVRGLNNKWQILQKASKLGKQILKYVNEQLKYPMKEKLERIYFPCILVTKKRYVGQSYNPSNIPDNGYFDINKIYSSIDSKGVESIRRELPEVTREIVAKCISILFANNNLSELSDYIKTQIFQFLYSKPNFSKMIFTRSYNDSTDSLTSFSTTSFNKSISNKSYCLIPESTDRIDYIVTDSNSKLLQNNVKAPQDFFEQNLTLNENYYFQKMIINQLKRLFYLAGIDCEKIVTDCMNIYHQQQSVLLNNIYFSRPKLNQITNQIQNIQQIQCFQEINNQQISSESKIIQQIPYNSVSSAELFDQQTNQTNMSCLFCGNTQQLLVEQQIVICQQCFVQKQIKKQVQIRNCIIEEQFKQEQESLMFILQYCQQNCKQCAFTCQNYRCPFKILYEEKIRQTIQYNNQYLHLQQCLESQQNYLTNSQPTFEISLSSSSDQQETNTNEYSL